LVVDVQNVPPGCQYEVKDHDDLDAAGTGATDRSGSSTYGRCESTLASASAL